MDSESNITKIKSIVVTGTKGKTTVVNMIASVLTHSSKDNISVDTLGSYFNLVRSSNYEESLKIFGKSPNVMPGRYIYYLLKEYDKPPENLFAVLEASLGSAKHGVGIDTHDVGIFTNVFRDHVNGDTIKDENDIYVKKSFVFNNIKENGLYIANLDNEYSARSLTEKILEEKKAILVGVTTKVSDLEELNKLKETYKLSDLFYFKDNTVYSFLEGAIYDLNSFRYYMNGLNTIMIENVLYVFASCLKYLTKEEISVALDSYLLPTEYGRFLGFKKEDQIVMIDYAHEINSLTSLINLLGKAYNKPPYVITRVAPDRVDSFLKEYAQGMAKIEGISGLTLYDKVDGIEKNIYMGRKITRTIGETSEIMLKEIQNQNVSFPVKRILNEVEALDEAITSGNKVIIFIFSDIEKVVNLLEQKGFTRYL